MIRCTRLWTGPDGDSLFQSGVLTLKDGERGDLIGEGVDVTSISFRETASGGAFAWHQDPEPRFVITLSGTLEFETRCAGTFVIRPGDILLAEDNSGTGHRWRLLDAEPWRRAYVTYAPGAAPQFTPDPPQETRP